MRGTIRLDLKVPFIVKKKDKVRYFVKIRPYAEEFIKLVSQFYEIIVFTASTKDYADAIIKLLDPKDKYIDFVLTRKNCMKTKKQYYIKDLRILKNRHLKNIIIVDNLVHSFGL